MRALGLAVADPMVIERKDGEPRIRSLEAAVRRAQEIVRKYGP